MNEEHDGMRKLTKLGSFGFDLNFTQNYTKIGLGFTFHLIEMEPPAYGYMMRIELLFFDFIFVDIKMKPEEEEDDRN